MKMRLMLLPLLAGSVVMAQDAAPAKSAAELLEQLRAAGVEIPEGFTANDDGTVSVPVPPSAETPVSGAADEAGATADAQAAPEVKKAEWDTKLVLALTAASGNTESIGFASTIVSKRTTETSALTLDAAYFYGSQDGDKNANQFTAGVQHDWLFKDSRWFVFADARFDWDEFKSYDYRVSAHGGVGYKLIDKDSMTLTLRAGAGGAKEFGSGRNQIIPEALLGADFSWQIADNQSFEASHRFYPDLDQGGEFRMVTTAGWKLDIDKDDGLSFAINLLHEYESDVDPGVENSDLKVFAGLSYDF
ncbi:MAG: DUF481 domain-containing protein [Phycisphaeraceae bacterium]|nr:MAG: DUF481 domain-containing protein [Phycisphaeraceae bacterium]